MPSLGGWNHTENAKEAIGESAKARWQDPVERAKFLNRPNVKKCQPGCTCGHHKPKACKPGCTCKKHGTAHNAGKPSPLKGRTHSSEVTARQVAARRAGAGWIITDDQR